jgi:hypothetical protein
MIYVYIYIYIYVCKYICIYIYVFVCNHTYLYISTDILIMSGAVPRPFKYLSKSEILDIPVIGMYMYVCMYDDDAYSHGW